MVSHCARSTRGVRDCALREHRRSTGFIPSSAPGARNQQGIVRNAGRVRVVRELGVTGLTGAFGDLFSESGFF